MQSRDALFSHKFLLNISDLERPGTSVDIRKACYFEVDNFSTIQIMKFTWMSWFGVPHLISLCLLTL